MLSGSCEANSVEPPASLQQAEEITHFLLLVQAFCSSANQTGWFLSCLISSHYWKSLAHLPCFYFSSSSNVFQIKLISLLQYIYIYIWNNLLSEEAAIAFGLPHAKLSECSRDSCSSKYPEKGNFADSIRYLIKFCSTVIFSYFLKNSVFFEIINYSFWSSVVVTVLNKPAVYRNAIYIFSMCNANILELGDLFWRLVCVCIFFNVIQSTCLRGKKYVDFLYFLYFGKMIKLKEKFVFLPLFYSDF